MSNQKVLIIVTRILVIPPCRSSCPLINGHIVVPSSFKTYELVSRYFLSRAAEDTRAGSKRSEKKHVERGNCNLLEKLRCELSFV